MAFPVHASTDWAYGDASSKVTTANLPASVALNDLLICVATLGDFSSPVLPTAPSDSTSDAWTRLFLASEFFNKNIAVYYKIADGDEDGGTLTITYTAGGTNNNYVHGVIRVTGWYEAIGLEYTHDEINNDATPGATSSLSPTWGSDDNLWFSILHVVNDSGAPTGIIGPSSYTFDNTKGNDVEWDAGSTGSAGMKVAIASRQLAAASETSGAWSKSPAWDSTDDFAVTQLVVRPAAAGGVPRRGPFGDPMDGRLGSMARSMVKKNGLWQPRFPGIVPAFGKVA